MTGQPATLETRGIATARRLAIALCLVPLTLACVTRGTHRQVVDDRDRLSEQNRKLSQELRRAKASNESLSGERVRLFDELEDLRSRREDLERSVKKLGRDRGPPRRAR